MRRPRRPDWPVAFVRAGAGGGGSGGVPLGGTTGQVLAKNSATNYDTGWLTLTADVVGPAAATNNAVVLFDGTTGKLLKNSVVIVNAGAITGVTDFTMTGNAVIGNATTDTVTIAGSLAVDTSVLTVNPTTNRVGINVALSSTLLDLDIISGFGVRPSTTEVYPTALANGIPASFHTIMNASAVFGWALTRVGNHTYAPSIEFYKTRSTTGSATAVVNGDTIATFGFQAASSATIIRRAAAITAVVNGTVSSGTVPVDLVVQVSPSADAFGTTGAVWRFVSDGVLRPETHNAVSFGTTSVRPSTVFGVLGDFTTSVTTATSIATTRVTTPLIGTITAVDVVIGRNSVTQLTLGSLAATFAGTVAGTAFSGTTWTGTGLIQTTLTTEQARLRYDAANYLSVTVGISGAVTFDAVGAGAAFTFSDTVNAASFVGALTGNATTATTLQTARDFSATGDATAPAVSFNGAANVALAMTLATVNANVGTFGSSTSIPTFTVNAKGLITAASGNVVIAPAGTLTGTTLAANVVTSSLTTIGTLVAGAVPLSLVTAGTSPAGTFIFPTLHASVAIAPVTNDAVTMGASGNGFQSLWISHNANRAVGLMLVQTLTGTGSPRIMFGNTTDAPTGGNTIYQTGADQLSFTTGGTPGSASGTARWNYNASGIFPTTTNAMTLGNVSFVWSNVAATRLTAPLIGTTTATDVVFDRNSVTQLTLSSLLATFAGAVRIGTTVAATGTLGLDVVGLLSFVGSNNVTDLNDKLMRLGGRHYTNAEEAMAGLVLHSASGSSILYIGGGSPSFNAATSVQVYTAANTITTTGTLRASWNSAGVFAQVGDATIGGTLGVTGNSTLTGVVGIGGANAFPTNYALEVNKSAGLTAANTYGIAVDYVTPATSTTSMHGFVAVPSTVAAVFTVISGYGFRAATPVIGAGSAITTMYGFYANNQGATGITNAYGVYIAAQSGAATTNIGLYNAGTTTLVGAATLSSTLDVTTTLTTSGTTALLAQSGTTASVTVGTGTGTSTSRIDMQSAAGQIAWVGLKSGTLDRWAMYKDTTAETGSNAGSPLRFASFTDAGAFQDLWLTVTRASGGTIAFSTARPITAGTYNGQTISSAAIFTGTASAVSTVQAGGGFIIAPSANSAVLRTTTVDGVDATLLSLTPASAASFTRGAILQLAGNEEVALGGGFARLGTGDIAGATLLLAARGVTAVSITRPAANLVAITGDATVSATFVATTSVSTALLIGTTRVTSPLLGTTTAVDVVLDRNSVTQLTLASLAATFAGTVAGTAFSGTSWTGTGLIQTTLTTEQMRLRYDATNYVGFVVSSTGALSFVTGGTARSVTFAGFSGGVTLPGGLISYGANDSGGAGFRQVLVPNV